VQGFGNAGRYAYTLSKKIMGSKVVAISDSEGAIYDPDGLDLAKLDDAKKKTGSVQGYSSKNAKRLTNDQLLELKVDILIPAAIESQVRADNADKIKCKLLLELANGPVTPEATDILFQKGIVDLPDFLVNSGGVVGSYFEWVQNQSGYYWDTDEFYTRLDKIITRSFHDTMAAQKDYAAKGKKISPRMAAYTIAVDRVARAMKAKGWY
ncbi:MAG: Glu/Leu/Phe/Val dehydrogenase, partial [Candidatus Micrarchaeales archaeon]